MECADRSKGRSGSTEMEVEKAGAAERGNRIEEAKLSRTASPAGESFIHPARGISGVFAKNLRALYSVGLQRGRRALIAVAR
jgi:hypothetical protein